MKLKYFEKWLKLDIFVYHQTRPMSARDKYHNNVKEALSKEDWKITHDPYIIGLQGVNYQIDLG